MLINALLRHGHSADLWVSAFDHISHKHIHTGSCVENINDRLTIHFIKGCGYPSDRAPVRFLHNRQTAKEFKILADSCTSTPDIIFAPIPTLELTQAAVHFATQKGIKVIVDIRDLWPDIYLTMFPIILRPLARILFTSEFRRAKNIFDNATAITAVSESYLHRGLQFAKRSRNSFDQFFPLGSSEFKPVGAAKMSHSEFFSNDSFVFCFVGTFSTHLDIQTMIDAAKIIEGKNTKIRIVIIGEGNRSAFYFKQAAKLSNILMPGWLDSATVNQILRQSDVGLVAYSRKALMSLPNKPFEYMAAGLPLLSSLKGELEQLISQYHIGCQYDASNASSLADKMIYMFEKRDEARVMGENAFALFKSKYEATLVYDNFVSHLERVFS
jgi:glycosyltransferase involved in cell wall biosynthesis